jgi:hypothetical protein
MVEQAPPQLDVHPVGGVTERVAAQELWNCLEQAERHHAYDQHHERRHALVEQNFVDHELEKDRRHQGEQLHKQRSDQHMCQRSPVAQNRRPEPAETELLGVDAGAAEPARNLHQLARGQGGDVLDRELLRRPRDRIDQPRPPPRRTHAEHTEGAALQADHRRERSRSQSHGRDALADARFQPKEVRGADKVLRVCRSPRQRELMTQLRRVRGVGSAAGGG